MNCVPIRLFLIHYLQIFDLLFVKKTIYGFSINCWLFLILISSWNKLNMKKLKFSVISHWKCSWCNCSMLLQHSFHKGDLSRRAIIRVSCKIVQILLQKTKILKNLFVFKNCTLEHIFKLLFSPRSTCI